MILIYANQRYVSEFQNEFGFLGSVWAGPITTRPWELVLGVHNRFVTQFIDFKCHQKLPVCDKRDAWLEKCILTRIIIANERISTEMEARSSEVCVTSSFFSALSFCLSKIILNIDKIYYVWI